MPQTAFLSKDEVNTFNQQGMKLDNSRMYILKFAFNDQRNKAVDPIDFQIDTNSLDKIAQTAIGRPYVFNPGIKDNQGEHVRGPVDDPAKIVQFQKDYAIGDIVSWYRNPKTNNVYFIIEIYPEFQDDVVQGKIPYPTSPLIEPLDMTSDRVVKDAIVLHLQAVPFSGYPMQLSSKLGVCKGMLDKCSAELRTLGSSGQLKKFRKQFSYSNITLGSSMSAEQGQSTPQMKVEDIVAKHDQMLADHAKTLGSIGDTLKEHGDALGQIMKNTSGKAGNNYPGTDNSLGQTTGSGGMKPTGPAGSQSGTYGSAGEEELIQVPKSVLTGLETDLKGIKDQVAAREKELQTEKEKFAEKERNMFAKIIADGEALTREITVDKIAERIKFYVELKGTDGKPADLTLLAAKYDSMKKKTLGSSGNTFFEEDFPSIETLGASGTQEKTSILDIMESIG